MIKPIFIKTMALTKKNTKASIGTVVKLSAEQKKVEAFLKKIAKEFDYSTKDAARFVKDTISKMGL